MIIMKRIANLITELYTFEKDNTLYKIAICDLGEDGKILTGGRFLITLLSPKYQAYCFNEYYKTPNYIKEKFPSITYRDAENIADFLNFYFELRFGDKINNPSRVIKRNDNVFEVTRE
jgi:hypothetical protein